ncbi:uncharacterized protein BCR38DRAFT_440279 [Pseudomassariella vexata]|uniref:RRM domain-containing protein n=1 Tax=Pseudomassariella vexata TaxID=1141098 RepID=A0A1Y2DQA3_9PEZI|nr:uncharacterized protein BCR38DRAFT_440279 [Pseudomassariella vexata]ORY61471.1 hypothetical protein BCR38DRAFT_440279 [Pseudomassariella vexata]
MVLGTTPNKSTIASSADSDGYTRLHITPFDAELLSIVVPASVLPQVRNISYHTIQTYPEKRYGYVELPTMDADKIKKKLNGAVLKGTKVRVETAKPKPVLHAAPIEEEDGTEQLKKRNKDKKSTKRKRDGDTIAGVELEDRKIKRGWTVSKDEMIKEKREKSKDKSKRSKDNVDKDEKAARKEKKEKKKMEKRKIQSKFTDGPECLFKQKIPEVPSSAVVNDDGEADGFKKKKRKYDRQIVVHEFENNTKHPSFLKSSVDGTKPTPVTFEDGKGWLDANGDVVEPAKAKKGPPAPIAPPKKKKAPEPAPVLDDDEETSSSGSSSSDDESDEAEESSEEEVAEPPPSKKAVLDSKTLISPLAAVKTADSSRPRSSGSNTSLTIKIPPVTPAPAKVHPLEALYKRTQGDAQTPNGIAKESKPFSFFNNEDDMEGDDASAVARPSQVPLTPYTKEDFEFRNIRSAAPTPDTAHPSRSYNLWSQQGSLDEALEEEDEEEAEEAHEDTAMVEAAGTDGSKPQDSEFQDWFWKNRGDLNRSWKKRRKTATKEKRNRENRARAARAI